MVERRVTRSWVSAAVAPVCLLVALLSVAATPSSSQDTGFDPLDLSYFRAFASASVGRGFGAARFADGLDLSPGAEAYDASVGVDLGRHLSLELNAGYVEFDVTASGVGKVGELTLATFVPQLRVRMPVRNGRWVPWIAGGAGFATLTVNDRTLAGVDVFEGPLEYTSAFSIDAGVEYFVAPNIGLTGQLQYQRAARDITLLREGTVVEGVGAAVSSTFGLRVYFPRTPPPGMFDGVSWTRPEGLRGDLYFSVALGLRGYRDRSVTPDAMLRSTGGSEQTVTLSIGAELDPRLGFELTGVFHEIPIWTSQKLVEFSTWLVAPRIRVRIPDLPGPFVPHVMGGVGLGLGETNDAQPVNAADPGGGFAGRTTSFAATIGAGVSAAVQSNVELYFEYQYLYQPSQVNRGEVPISLDMSATQKEWGIRLHFR